MMYKNRVKKWVGMIFLLAICIILNTDINVFAACEKGKTNAQKTADAAAYYGIQYTVDTNTTGKKIKDITLTVEHGEFYIKLLDENNLGNRDAKKIVADDSIPIINQDKPLKAGKPYKITAAEMKKYARAGATDLIIVPFTKGDSSSKDTCGKISYQMIITVGESEDEEITTSPTLTHSIYYDTKLCAEARKLSWAVDQEKDLQKIVNNALTPCIKNQIPYNISYKTLSDIYEKVKVLVNTYTESKSNNKITMEDKLPDLSADWVKVNKTNFNQDKGHYTDKDKTMLTCDAKNEKTVKRFFYEETTPGEAIIKTKTGTTTVKACETTCREQVEVNYGPPKAVIAGQCFTYEVEIKSKVVCNARLNLDEDKFPKYEDYMPCQIAAHCSNSSGYGEQAGPKEEFDKCVSTCDGGEYTQSCIDSCYNKVYGKKNSSKTSNSNKKVNNNTDEEIKNNVKIYAEDTLTLNDQNKIKNKVQKVVNNNIPASEAIACPSISTNVTKEDIIKVYNYVNGNIAGVYRYDGGVLAYHPVSYNSEENQYKDMKDNIASCEWAQYGSSYFRNLGITARTVCNDRGLDWDSTNPTECAGTNHAQCYNTATCYPGIRRNNGVYNVRYSAASDGFKRSSVCRQNCSWYNTGYRFDGSQGACYENRADAESDYKASIESYVSALQSCINKASTCVSDEETATYTMVANTDVQTGKENQTCDSKTNGKNCLTFGKETNPVKKNTKIDNRKAIDNATLKDNTILKFIGGSCTNEKNTEWIYHTIITFPGAWINNKNGEISYNKQDERYYKHYTGNYCTPLNAKNVNANWWLWYQYTKENKTSKTFEKWASDTSLVYNIFSTIRKFGLYNWSMNVGCFYAINNQTPPADTPPEETPTPETGEGEEPTNCKNKSCPPTTKTGDETSTDFDNYTSKSISTSTMFPSTKTSTKSTDKASVKKLSYTDKLANNQKMANSETRTEGFNWSVEATNLSIEGYPVTPSALVKKIESGNTYDESELDYHITLTKDNIKELKKLNDYTEFNGTYVDKTVSEKYKKAYKDAGYTEGSVPSYTYYKSDKVLRKNIYVTRHKLPNDKGLACNNLKSSDSCDITLSGFTIQDNELQKWLSNVK